jgi:hypothetical protein
MDLHLVRRPVLRALDVLRTRLMTFGYAGLRSIGVLRTRLMTFGYAGLRSLSMLRPRPLPFRDALRPLDMLRPRLLAFGALGVLRTLHSRSGAGLALRPLRRMVVAVVAATTLRGVLGAIAPLLAVRPRARRGCDRQRGNARCEKHPGHDFVSSRTVKRPVRGTVPTSKRMELALYRTSVNLKLLCCSES